MKYQIKWRLCVNSHYDPNGTVMGTRARMEYGELKPGDVILGRYELLEKLGSGAMGVVFQCKERISGEIYALKMVPPELSRDDEIMAQIKENYALIHNLKFPSIASVDFLEQDQYGAYYLIMEFASGVNLSRWLRKKRQQGDIPQTEIFNIVTQIAQALDYAHSKKVLHRDIKPANIMVNDDGEVKILDFGLASKVRSSLSNLSINPANSSGTPNYLAPEQFKGQYPRPASDQYALAVLTFEMLTGYLPFEGAGFDVLRSAVVNDAPEIPANLSPAVAAALKKALAKSPAERFKSCTAFADALSTPEPDVAVAAPHTSVEAKKKNPHPYWLWALLFIVAVIFVILFSTTTSSDESPVKINVQKEPTVVKTDPVPIQYNSEAERRYLAKALAGDAEAQYNLGVCYKNGDGIEKNLTKAVKWYEKAAEQGYASAQCNLGYCYEFGVGVEKNILKAVDLYKKAAEQGDATAQYNLGLSYKNGNGVEENIYKAVEWYEKAAAQGFAPAQCSLGFRYELGEGVEKNIYKAVEWYKKAAEQGNATAQCNLGVCYQNGEGVEKNIYKAVEWYEKAAAQGNATAQCNLGYCYEFGQGVEKNIHKAVEWYEKAAAQGDAPAQYNLGMCYEFGQGVEKNIQKAVKWYEKAAAQGVSKAKERLQELGR